MNAVSLTTLFVSGIDICPMGEWRQAKVEGMIISGPEKP
jgi:hypothetical protein